MAGLGCLQRGLGRLGVAQLADQDHVGVLAQHAAKRLVERVGVETDFALVDDAVDVGVQDLDRVLDRDDVLLPRPVDVAEHRGERRRLAATGGAGDEHEPAMLLRELLDARRQAEAAEVGICAGMTRNAKEMSPRCRNALTRNRGRSGKLVGGVHLARLVEDGGRGGATLAPTVFRISSRSSRVERP